MHDSPSTPPLPNPRPMRPSTSIYRQHTGLVYAVADPLDRILPSGVQPHALCKFYPRVANLIALMCTDKRALRVYFDELLVDRRRCRKGFPRDVFNDLRVLRDYYGVFSPNTIDARNREPRKS